MKSKGGTKGGGKGNEMLNLGRKIKETSSESR